MAEILDDGRLRQLMGDADQALDLLASAADNRDDFQVALDTIYRDLGAHLHTLVRGRAPISPASSPGFDDDPDTLDVPSLPDPSQTDATGESFGRGGWYTEEEDNSVPLFTEGDLGGSDLETEIPESTTLTSSADADPEDLPLVTLAALKRDARAPDGDLARLRAGREAPPWRADLSAFLDLLAPPEDLYDHDAMPEEASRVQWGTTQLDRLNAFPHSVQLAILALLAARAHHLAALLDVDIGPRMALDRLKRFRDIHALPYVSGLVPHAAPERDTWAEDAAMVWRLLRPDS